MKNKYKLLLSIIVIVFIVIFFFTGSNILNAMSSISKVTGDIISKTEENKDYNPEEVVCLDPEYARNYNDCIVFENTQQKQNTLVKLSDEATTSFCNELLKVYSKCE